MITIITKSNPMPPDASDAAKLAVTRLSTVHRLSTAVKDGIVATAKFIYLDGQMVIKLTEKEAR